MFSLKSFLKRCSNADWWVSWWMESAASSKLLKEPDEVSFCYSRTSFHIWSLKRHCFIFGLLSLFCLSGLSAAGQPTTLWCWTGKHEEETHPSLTRLCAACRDACFPCSPMTTENSGCSRIWCLCLWICQSNMDLIGPWATTFNCIVRPVSCWTKTLAGFLSELRWCESQNHNSQMLLWIRRILKFLFFEDESFCRENTDQPGCFRDLLTGSDS